MSAVLKKTLYFAVPSTVELNKTLSKNLVLENVLLDSIEKQTENHYNVVNIKLTTDEDETLTYEFDELEEILQEKGNEYVVEFLKKFPGSYALSNKEVEQLTDKFDADREAKLTAHLNDEQKMVRSALVAFKKDKNLSGSEASFVVNIFDDIISLRLIEEDTLIGGQKKSINDIFKDKHYLTNLLITEIEELQVKVVRGRNNGVEAQLTEEEKLAINIKGVWPDWKGIRLEKQNKEQEAQALIDSQKRPRGRPRKNVF